MMNSGQLLEVVREQPLFTLLGWERIYPLLGMRFADFPPLAKAMRGPGWLFES
jgi:hypothetical protein